MSDVEAVFGLIPFVLLALGWACWKLDEIDDEHRREGRK